jgi:hypothetical protein
MSGAPPIRIVQSIDLQNPTPVTVDLSGWKLRINDQTVTLPQNARMGPMETVTIHFTAPPATPAAGTSGTTAVGTPTTMGNDIFLGTEGAQLASALRPGARVMLQNPQGQTVTEFALPA